MLASCHNYQLCPHENDEYDESLKGKPYSHCIFVQWLVVRDGQLNSATATLQVGN
jgi:hypothetical protein